MFGCVQSVFDRVTTNHPLVCCHAGYIIPFFGVITFAVKEKEYLKVKLAAIKEREELDKQLKKERQVRILILVSLTGTCLAFPF